MSVTVSYVQGSELPTFTRPWLDADGDPVPLSALTLSLRIGSDPPIEKTSGVTGDADGVLTIAWAAGELDSIDPDAYAMQVWARNGSTLDRVMDDMILQIKPQIAQP